MHFIPLIAISLSKISTNDIAGLLTALGGIVIGILTARHTSKNDKASLDQAQRQSILEGYGQIVKDLQAEIERIRHQYSEDLEQWDKDKQTWQEEKVILLKQLNLLQEQAVQRTKRTRKKVTDEDTTTNG